MSELKRHDIEVTYVVTEKVGGHSSIYPPIEVARIVWREWGDYRFTTEPEILSITVDGETFTLAEVIAGKKAESKSGGKHRG